MTDSISPSGELSCLHGSFSPSDILIGTLFQNVFRE
jgi:hypothetical protein